MTASKRMTLSRLARTAAAAVLGVPWPCTDDTIRTQLSARLGTPDIGELVNSDILLDDPNDNRLLTAARLLLDHHSEGVGPNMLPFLRADYRMPEARRMFTDDTPRRSPNGQLAFAF